MNTRTSVLFAGLVLLMPLATQQVAADPVGVVTVNATDALAESMGLRVCRVYAQYDDPSDKLLSVGFADISTDDPLGFYQHELGQDTAPVAAACSTNPSVCLDSFVTIGLLVNSSGDETATDPSFNTCSFNCLPQPPCVPGSAATPAGCGRVVGGWYNADPTNTQGHPDGNLQVPIAQLTVRAGYNAIGQRVVFSNLGSGFTGTFECFDDPCVSDGECEDADPCTADQCLDGDCIHPPVGCDDGDACTVDSCIPSSGDCQHTIVNCDDGNLCTTDSCDSASGCVNAANNDLCDDGNACTVSDVCTGGVCTGDAVDCSDGDACTVDVCNPFGDSTCCVDTGLPGCDNSGCEAEVCTIDSFCCDVAWDTTCAQEALELCGELCLPAGCSHTPLDCDDGDLCTIDSCDAQAGCTYETLEGPCDDGDPCTLDDVCAGGDCVGIPLICDDGIECTNDACVAGACINSPVNAACSNGLFCDGAETCNPVSGCQPGTPPCTTVPCNEDTNTCTFATCPGSGSCCQPHDTPGCSVATCCNAVCAANASCCDAEWSAACATLAESLCSGCGAGQPIGLKAVDKTSPAAAAAGLVTFNVYAQFNSPTAKLLSVGFANLTVSNSAPNAANPDGGFYHNSTFGQDLPPNCVFCPLVPLLCEDSFVTIGPKCNPPASTATDPDFNSALFNTIAGGSGVTGGWFNADPTNTNGDPDANLQVLIAQFTVSAGGTVTGTLTLFYNTGTAFPTFLSAGSEPGCASNADCNDSNVCTTDLCNPDGSCSSLNNNNPCSDGNACTTNDTCSSGNCSGAPISCDDANACTLDTCNASTGCVHAPVTGPCDDGLFCNGVDQCANGACSVHAGDPCGGGTPCTANCCNEAADNCFCPAGTPCGNSADSDCDNPDTADGQGGISTNPEPNGAPCNDGNACTVNDSCQSAMCTPGPPVDCADDDQCTIDGCNPASGCTYELVECNDGDPCTIDDCDANSGCVNTPQCASDADCDDGDAGTIDSCGADGCCEHAGGIAYPLDIKYGKCPNKVKLGSGGKTNVAVLGTADLDVALIDLDSVRMRACGGSVSIAPHKPPRIKDKATPFYPQGCDAGCGCHKKKKDYIDDVEMKFLNSDIETLIPDAVEGEKVDMEVYGTLLDGTPWVSYDCILVDRPGSPGDG